MIHWLAGLLILLQLAFPSVPRLTQLPSDLTFSDSQAQPVFGQHITFQTRIEPPAEIEKVLVYITPSGQPTVWEAMSLDQQGRAVLQVDVRRLSLPPFSTINYRFEAILRDGQTFSSQPQSFQYQDDRFEWQAKTGGIFEVYWYGGDVTLGQEILNVAEAGLEAAQELLPVDPPALIRIYAYTSSLDLQSALQLAPQSWVAGHASPELSMILISVPTGPEKKLELQRQIPHEIMHLLQYQVTGRQYERQPMWLLEGMASLAELYPSPEYQRVLEATARGNEILPMESLCAAFPPEAGLAFRSYAQSESFVSYLHSNFGTAALRDLMEQYQNGLGCKEGFAAAFDVPLSQFEYRWKQEVLGINPGGLALRRLSPYFLLGLIIILPAALALWPYPRRQENSEDEIE